LRKRTPRAMFYSIGDMLLLDVYRPLDTLLI
jgi:hypothetical protein